MQASKHVARILIATLLLAPTLLMAAAPAWAAGNPVPALSINGFTGQREAAITASQPAAVTFTGNYTVTKLSLERAVVTFTATVSTGWPATVSPATLTVSGGAALTGILSVTVIVPSGTSATDIAQLIVIGRAVAGGLQSVPAQAQGAIIPLPYFRVIASSTNPFVETAYSTQVVLAYKIYNEGNVRDQVKVNVNHLDDLSADGWVIVMSRQSFQIEPTLFQDIQITVGLPKQWHLYSDNQVKVIEIVVSSGGAVDAGGSFTDSLPVFVRTVGFSSPGFDVPLALLGAVIAAMMAGTAGRRPRRRLVK